MQLCKHLITAHKHYVIFLFLSLFVSFFLCSIFIIKHYFIFSKKIIFKRVFDLFTCSVLISGVLATFQVLLTPGVFIKIMLFEINDKKKKRNLDISLQE